MDNNDSIQLQQECNLNCLSQEFICSYIDEVIAATRNGTADWRAGFVMKGCECRICLFRGRFLLYRGGNSSQELLYVTCAVSDEVTQRYMERRNFHVDFSGVTVSGNYAVRVIQRIEEAHHICATRRDRREWLKRIVTDDTCALVLGIAGIIGLIYFAVCVALRLRA